MTNKLEGSKKKKKKRKIRVMHVHLLIQGGMHGNPGRVKNCMSCQRDGEKWKYVAVELTRWLFAC